MKNTLKICKTLFYGAVLCAAIRVQAADNMEITTFAGTGEKGYSGDGGPAVKAQMNNISGIVRGPDGALYIVETSNHVVRRVAPDGTISTAAGNGSAGYSGDGGPATKAQLNEPYEVRFDKAGHMFIVERLNHALRRVDGKTGVISTLAGTGKAGFSGDGGPAAGAALNQPHSLQFGPDGTLYIADIGNHRIRKIDNNGAISTFGGTGQKGAAPDGAPLTGTPLNGPRAMDFDAEGNMWLALREGNALYKIDMKAGTLHRVAGNGKSGFTGNGGPAREATLSGPKCVGVAPNGDVYLADTESHSIRKIDIKRGTLELVAGTGSVGHGPNGDPLTCKLARPHGVWIDPDGSVFVGDSDSHCVRVIRPKK